MAKDCMHADMELAQGVARNDAACIRAFFRAYHAGVYRYMLCLTNNVEDAEDLAQDSMLKAKSHIRSYRGESGLKTWVHRVAFHTFTHWNRRRRPTNSLSPQLISQTTGFGQVDAASVLLEALSKIGSALAQPLVLQEINDLSVEEIAKVLDIPAGTVKSRLFTARQRLREIIGDPNA
jgi:RNA polymerase sigma-70 factor, ECF subfamily